jgi:hypothetical protein
MAPHHSIHAVSILAGLICFSCLPLRDLDGAAAGRGTGGTGSGGMAATGGAGGAPSTLGSGGSGPGQGTGGVGSDGSPETADLPVDTPIGGPGMDVGVGGAVSSGGATGLGGLVGTDGAASTRGGATGSGGTIGRGGTSGGAGGISDIDNSPVLGEITYSAGASWDIDGTQWPAFEIHTPTASYWLVKADAAIVSITDGSQIQWINFSSGFRPNRGVPNLGGCCQPGNPAKLGKPTMTTELDPAFTVTSSHLRLVSKSEDESYWLVWDFFLTHFTLTINRAAAPFGFTYRGVPEGALGPADQLVVAGGTSRAAANPFTTTLPGPSGWAYLTHPATKHSLFMIQHSDDTLTDTYRIADGDTAMFVFGNGQMEKTPARFSLGLVESCDEQVVSKRIAFVQGAIPSL